MNCIMAMLAVCACVQTAEEDSPLSLAAAVIDHQDASIQAFDAEYVVDIRARSSVVVDAGKMIRQVQKFREQRKGDRFRSDREITINVADRKPPERFLQSFDGAQFFGYDELNKSGGIFSEGQEPTCLAQTLYLSQCGLAEMFRRHAQGASTQWIDFQGHRLLAVEWDEADGASRRTLYLDPGAAYQPRRYTLETEYPDGYYPDGRQRGKLSGEIKKFFQYGEFFLPEVVEIVHDEVDAQGQTVRTMTKVTRVRWIDINPALNNKVFAIDFPKGTRVKDKDRGVWYVVGQPGSETPIDDRQPVVAPPAFAGPAHDLWSDWRVWTAFSAVCLGLLIWARRKGLA
jgi:hypothetical protein